MTRYYDVAKEFMKQRTILHYCHVILRLMLLRYSATEKREGGPPFWFDTYLSQVGKSPLIRFWGRFSLIYLF
jgi:hypothetical protein